MNSRKHKENHDGDSQYQYACIRVGDFGKLCKTIPMAAKKNIAMVAHDYKKDELLEWAKFNRKLLAAHSLYSAL
jgi:hypothetical protein